MEFTKTTRGAPCLLLEGHRYHINRRGKDERVFWRCHNRNCTGRLTTVGDMVMSSKEHSHPGDSVDTAVEKAKSQMRDHATTGTAPIPRVYNDAVVQLAAESSANQQEVATVMPTYPSLKSGLYRHRQKNIPPLPKDRAAVNLEGEWTKTSSGDRFLLRSDGDQNKILLFATDAMLARLPQADTLYMDGTFEVCPRLFFQLFTINIIVSGQQFPAVYALLPGKSRETYNRFFTILKEELQNLGITLRPPRVLVDFETSLLQSVKLHFPDTDIKGCFFHFAQCLWRWVQSNGHTTLYKENGEFKKFVRRAASLAFLPAEHVTIAWSILRLNCAHTSAAATGFARYFRDTWVRGFAIAMWNHSSSDQERTNNRLEGWHNRLNRLAASAHPNIYQLIALLKKEEAVSQFKIMQLTSGGLPVRKQAKWQRLDRRIKRLQKKFAEGRIGMEEFLECASGLCGL